MHRATSTYRTKTRSAILIVVVGVLLPALCGAIDLELPGGISLKYGKLERNSEITKLFQTYQILPDHNYYYSGWGSVPYAIIAIDKQYKLRKGLWKEIEATVPMLRNWVREMDIIYGYPPYGSRILDHKGQQLGVWYSSKQWTTIIIEEENEIAVFAPEPPGFRGGN
ncbi:MAG: hypothetical protein PVF86_12705 [Desulfobacterales bacterium]|jgi:hypothetical protein|nr:hypothetical protein [Deltaproteobacteria bacterium]MBW2440334.1 hypothetical protein [Deltaproteobacteria bacterium]